MTAAATVTVTLEQLSEVVRAAVRAERGTAELGEGWVTAEAVAKHFSVHRHTVDKWRTKGCPHEQRVDVVRFKLSAVESWFRGRGPGLRAVRP